MRPAPPSYAAVNAALCIDPINWPLFPAHAALASPHLDRATVSSVRPRPHRQVDTSDFDAGGRRRLKHRYSLSRSSPSIIYPGPSQWHLPEVRALGCDSSWSPHATRQDRMGNPLDGWIEGPGLPQSAWRYKWLISCLVLLGIFDRVAMAVYPTYAL